jgi:hypothetical protein
VVCAGNLRPGGAVAGRLTVNTPKSPVLQAGARLLINLNGSTSGVECAQLRVPEAVSLANAQLEFARSVSAPVVVGQKFVIVDNIGSSGPFDTAFASLPQNARLTNNGVVVQISYAGGDGNDVELTVVSAPATIDAVVALGDGTRQITGVCLAGQAYVLEAATNLSLPILWLPLRTNTAGASANSNLSTRPRRTFPPASTG